MARTRQEPGQGVDELIAVLLQAEDRYGRQRHPGEPWVAFLRRTLDPDVRDKLSRLDGPQKGSGGKRRRSQPTLR